MKIVMLLQLFLLLSGQYEHAGLNLIGRTGEEIKENNSIKEAGFHFNKIFDNGKVKFIKFIDSKGDKTLLYVMDDVNSCDYFLIMYDYSYLEEVLQRLNEQYEKTAELSWKDEKSGETFLIHVKKRDWFFTVITKKEE